jgi:predicted GNAT family acetyltransferase
LTSTTIRSLAPGDEPGLDAFLRRHADSSMFLRSNVRAAGLAYEGKPLQAEYVAACEGDMIVAVAAHCWNGMILVQCPDPAVLDAVVRSVVQGSKRAVSGISGPAEQVEAAARALGTAGRRAHKSGDEELFALDLGDLVVPPPLATGQWKSRRANAAELDLLTAWRVGFQREALHRDESPELQANAREEIELMHREGLDWVLEDGGRVVAYSTFNARLPDAVQVGGVWTPPEWRGRGYGRAVVAGSLLDARAQGVSRGILFAERPDAKRAYIGIGFRPVGRYGLILF